MIVKPARVAARFVDCITVLTGASAFALKAAGIDGVFRYLGSLSVEERDAILGAGLELGLVTYSRAPGWVPTPGMGQADGELDLKHLAAAGIPEGPTLCTDLEGCAGTAEQAEDWVNHRSDVQQGAGMIPGLYVGSFQPLGATALYTLPLIRAYWRSCSEGVPEPGIGWCIIQLNPPNQIVAGIQVDYNIVQADHKGRVPMVLAAS